MFHKQLGPKILSKKLITRRWILLIYRLSQKNNLWLNFKDLNSRLENLKPRQKKSKILKSKNSCLLVDFHLHLSPMISHSFIVKNKNLIEYNLKNFKWCWLQEMREKKGTLNLISNKDIIWLIAQVKRNNPDIRCKRFMANLSRKSKLI